MQLILKCKCTDGEVTISIRDRREYEDILEYMEHVQNMVGDWHQVRRCAETKLEYLKMQLVDGKPIGVSEKLS